MKSENFLKKEYEDKDFRMYFQNERSEMLRYIPENATKILDVGCSDGSFGQRLKSARNIEIWGVEPNEKAANIASCRLDKVICSTFNDKLELPKKSFDCIVFNDVLEHFLDPFAALEECKKFLTPEATLVASIPNVRYFNNIWNLIVKKEWKYEEQGILDKTHLRFFTEYSILRTLDELGFKVDLIKGINPIETEHPHHAKKFRMLNFLSFGNLKDMRYLQFAVVAHIK